MNEPLISVIIPTFNSSSTIELCLKSILNQTYTNVEVIIVDKYSQDNTVSIAKQYNCEVLQTNALRSEARNYGSEKAKGDFLLFIDADMELTTGVITECVNEVLNHNSDAIMIPEIRIGTGFWAQCRAIERLTYIGNPLIESARGFKKKAFELVGGFDKTLEAGEDWDLHARIENRGYKITSIRSIIKHNEGRLTLKNLVLKRIYYGKTLMSYVRKNPDRAKTQFIPLRLDYLKHWRILAKSPLYACGMIFMKTCEYIAVIISLISN